MLKSYAGNILIVGTGLGNDEFGGVALYVNNEVFKWAATSGVAAKYVDLPGAAMIKINRITKALEIIETEYLQARIERDAATGFWIYVRKAPPGVKVKQEFDIMIPLSNPFDIYKIEKPSTAPIVSSSPQIKKSETKKL